MGWKCASWMSLLAIMAVDVVATTIGIIVPSGSSYGAMNDRIHGSITSNATVPTDVLIGLRFVGDKTVPEVSPNPVVLQAGTSMANFSIVGRSPGRFHVDWELLSMGSPSPFNESSPMYALSSSSGAFVVFILNNQWPSVFYQVGLNVFVLVLGLGYFAWRRTSHVSIPFWGAHVEGLFRPVPFRTDDDTAASSSISEEDPQDPLDAASLRDRILRFWRLPIDDKLVVDRCGMETALCLHFLRDAGHVFVGLSVLSTVILNYVSGGAVTQSYQEATISNVPMGSHWFWGHVGMCYLSSAAVFWFVYRQHKRLSKLHRDDPTLVGPRSVFIQAGLPPLVDDLSHVYQILGQRMALRNEARRLIMNNVVVQELLTKFKARKGTGAAFVVFRSTAAKKAFLEHAVATQSPATKLRAHVAASLFRVQQHLRRHPLRHRFRHPSSPSLVESLHSSRT
ncbi:hypothetical protein DYB30_009405 [Aphanomyces astaci]|uniref:CSC1/OSCA1-like N-terminal transmembrane domain-containing protein n=1 Tax=Aphanomyces astaci TaxID=112090 RepID=A0A397E7K1_APHAT|nr:hypothetical protein DYB30_009405 [Aphanomyces astaci]